MALGPARSCRANDADAAGRCRSNRGSRAARAGDRAEPEPEPSGRSGRQSRRPRARGSASLEEGGLCQRKVRTRRRASRRARRADARRRSRTGIVIAWPVRGGAGEGRRERLVRSASNASSAIAMRPSGSGGSRAGGQLAASRQREAVRAVPRPAVCEPDRDRLERAWVRPPSRASAWCAGAGNATAARTVTGVRIGSCNGDMLCSIDRESVYRASRCPAPIRPCSSAS